MSEIKVELHAEGSNSVMVEVVERIDPSRVTFDTSRPRASVATIDGIHVSDLPNLAQRVKPGPRIKYTTTPEGDMLRLHAAMSFGGVYEGDRGGLVSSPDNLSHDGNCWVGEGSVVTGSVRIRGDVVVEGESKVTGYARIDGRGSITHSTIHEANLHGQLYVYNSKLRWGSYTGTVSFEHVVTDVAGGARLHDVQLTRGRIVVAPRGSDIYMAGVCARNFDIRATTDVVSMPTRFGPLNAFRQVRDSQVVLALSVGCQQHDNYEDMMQAARQNGCTQLEQDLLQAFFGMVDVVTPKWGLGETVTQPWPGDVSDVNATVDDDDDDD